MAEVSKISWTESSWNPLRAYRASNVGWQCEKVSPGCAACYAESMNRWRGTGAAYTPAGASQTTSALSDKALRWPLVGGRTKDSRRVFVCSMTDLFYEKHTNEQIAAIFGVMAAASNHQFQVLTKRPERALEWFEWAILRDGGFPSQTCAFEASKALGGRTCEALAPWPLPNVWLGVSCEDQARANERIPILLQIPAAVRWVSAEPLLGPIDLRCIEWPRDNGSDYFDALSRSRPQSDDVGLRGAAIDWVVVGGESSQRKRAARPCDVGWIRGIRDQCQSTGVPVFIKQLGSNAIDSSSSPGRRIALKDRKGETPAEWPEDLRVREYPR